MDPRITNTASSPVRSCHGLREGPSLSNEQSSQEVVQLTFCGQGPSRYPIFTKPFKHSEIAPWQTGGDGSHFQKKSDHSRKTLTAETSDNSQFILTARSQLELGMEVQSHWPFEHTIQLTPSDGAHLGHPSVAPDTKAPTTTLKLIWSY